MAPAASRTSTSPWCSREHPRPSLATIAAVLALVVALGSTSHAAGLLTGKQIKNESVTGKDVKRLTGADLDEASLGSVPEAEHAMSAEHAATAETVGDLHPQQLLTNDGCQPGTVRGSALVLAEDGTIPTTYSQSPQHLTSAHNCTGAAVQVRRVNTGQHIVKFLGNTAQLGTVQVRVKPASAPSCSELVRLSDGNGFDSNTFKVRTFNCATTAATDVDFSLVLT